MKPRLICFSLLLLLVAPRVCPQLPAPSPAAPPAAILAPDNAKAFDPAAATQAWLDTVPADKRQKSDAYFEGGYWLLLWNFLLGAAISIFLLQGRVSARLRDFCDRFTQFKALRVAVYAIAYSVMTFVLGLPLTIYQFYFREHAYNLANQTFVPWFVEQLIGLAVGTVALAIFAIVLYAVFRRAPRTWWAWGTVVATLFFIFGAMVAPVFVFPLFNKYDEVKDPAVRDPVLALAKANQIPVDNVYEFDASKQSNKISANVSGFLGTTRISLTDNLLKQCSLPEIRYVMGHEMGHYVLNHTQKAVSDFALLALICFLFTRWAFDYSLKKWGDRWEVRGISDVAGLPLLALILTIVAFVLTPVINSMSRVAEAEADLFGLNCTREPDGMARAALKLSTYRKLNPGLLEEIIFYDHPSGRARIRMAMDWKAAQLACGDVGTKP